MSVLTFSKAFLDRFANTVYPELHRRALAYNNFWKLHSTDKTITDVNQWLEATVSAAENDCEAILSTLPKHYDLDVKMLDILRWVKDNIVYTPDTELHGQLEYWQTPKETLLLRKGDCEDGAILILALAKHAGIPTDRYVIQWGEVIGGGHCYVVYNRGEDGESVVLDWCYWWTNLAVKLRSWIGDDKKYGTIWGAAGL